jgi:hypothetical protein
MLDRNMVRVLIVIMLVLMVGTGCSRYKPRPVDISKGEYYDDEEYEKMSNKDKEKYCNALAEELIDLQQRSETAQNQLQENKETIRQLTGDLRDAEREYTNLSAQVDELTKQLQELASLPKKWKLQYGECLWIVAGYEDIYGDPLKWTRIWRGNKGLIEDPDWVLAGWELNIPRNWPRQYTVQQDDWLARIAGYWEIYDDYKRWPVLFEANRNKINDPDLIFPEQELLVPR